MVRKLYLTTAWIALAVGPAPAAAAAPDPWLRIKSANFELFTTAGELSGRDLIRHFEQVRSFFVQVFGADVSSARPARVIAFRSDKEYEAYRPNQFAAAFFHPGADCDVIVMRSASRENYPVAVHEYTHLLIHQTGGKIPIWLNEGMAELYSNLEPGGGKIVVGVPIPGRMQSLVQDKWIDLRSLVAVDHDSPLYNEKSRAGMFYAESWALVHLLQLNPAYRPKFRDFIKLLKDRDAAAAFGGAFGKSIDRVQADLDQYMHGRTLVAAVFDAQLPKSLESPAIESGSSPRARLALAELLSEYRGRTEQARAAYTQLERDFPSDWRVQSGWAHFCERERQNDEAIRHFARAAQLGADDPRMFVEYGRVLEYANRNQDAVRALQKASGMDPSLEEAHFELGFALLQIGSLRDGLAELRLVKKVTPEQAPRYFYNMAYASYWLGDPGAARRFIEQSRPYAKHPDEIERIEEFTKALERSATPPRQAAPGTPAAQPQALRSSTLPPESEPEPQIEKIPMAVGTIEKVECLGKLAKLHVRVDGAVKKFLIPDPTSVIIRSGAGKAVDLQCGPQKARTVRVEYQATPATVDAAGIVRTLVFP
jgi:Flp pilus assembly protein TadD